MIPRAERASFGRHAQKEGSLRARRRVRLAICAAVFHLPIEDTATAPLACGPRVAAHSLSADMVISLPMIAREAEGRSQVLLSRGERGAMRGWVDSKMRTAATMSLSATGSRKAPKAEESFIFLAR